MSIKELVFWPVYSTTVAIKMQQYGLFTGGLHVSGNGLTLSAANICVSGSNGKYLGLHGKMSRKFFCRY